MVWPYEGRQIVQYNLEVAILHWNFGFTWKTRYRRYHLWPRQPMDSTLKIMYW